MNNNLEEVLGSVKPVSRYGGWHKMRVSVTLPKFDVSMDLDVKTVRSYCLVYIYIYMSIKCKRK